MRFLRPALILVTASAFLALAACKSSTYGGGESPEKPPAKPDSIKSGGESPEKPPVK